MKRIVLIVVMLLAGAALVSAIGLSVFAGGGYGLGMDKETYGTEIHGPAGNFSQYSNYFCGHGQGLKALGEVDITFADHFSIGLGGGYVENVPKIHLINHVDLVPSEDGWVRTSFVPAHLTLKGQIPVGVGRFNFYFGVGPSACFFAKSKFTEERAGAVVEYWKTEVTYTVGWGYHGVAGVEFPLGKRKRFFLRAEVRGEQLTFRPKKAVLTTYTENGSDLLMAMYPDVYDREIEYVRDLSDFANNPIDPNAPRQELAYNLSADSVAAYIGIVWRIF